MTRKKKEPESAASDAPKKAKEEPESYETELRIRKQDLSGVIQTLRAAVVEALIERDGDELLATVVDPSHVMMIVSRIRTAAGVDSFPKKEGLAFDLDQMRDNIRSFGPLEVIQLRFGSRKSKQLIIQANGTTMNQSRFDPMGITKPKVPNVTGKWTGYLNAGELLWAVREAGKVSDHISLRQPKDGSGGLRVSSEGETAKWERVLHVENETGEFEHSMYPLDMLKSIVESIVESAGARSTITIETGDEYPLKIGADMPYGDATFLLAPRVEED